MRVGTHACFVGPFSSYLAADPPVQHPGYRDIGWTMDAPGFGDGLRRRVGVRPEGLRGRLESLYCCIGEYDIVGIGDFPSNDAAAAFSLAAAAGGAAKARFAGTAVGSKVDPAPARFRTELEGQAANEQAAGRWPSRLGDQADGRVGRLGQEHVQVVGSCLRAPDHRPAENGAVKGNWPKTWTAADVPLWRQAPYEAASRPRFYLDDVKHAVSRG